MLQQAALTAKAGNPTWRKPGTLCGEFRELCLIENNHISCREAIEKLLKAREQSRLRKALSWFRKPNVLLLDEVGHEPLSPEQAHVFFQLINVRYETGSIVMTSNRPFSKWAELMSDEAVATAMLDRLLHHVQVVSLKADSYRMKERLRVGAVGFD